MGDLNLEFLTENDIHKRHKQDFRIEKPGAVFQIEKVVAQTAQHLLKGVGVAVVEGGIGGDTRANLEQVTVAGIALHNLVDVELALGAGTDEGHIATKHIPQLGKLVQVVLTQELAHTGEPHVLTARIECGAVLLGIEPHATELVNIERTTETPDTLLAEYGRSAVFALHSQVTNQKQGRKHD